ncbi:MAG TPA: hydrogenase maturation protease [Acidimicrobiales bacterium]|jgi:hydrogenase maturation protease|nr:hydrogenase maturation protease [Acidimicrobiales bacterium]
MKILVAGVGNMLLGDDGFGVEVARRMAGRDLPPGVRVVETGIAGIALVHELGEGFDALFVADAVDRGRPPGTVMVIEPDVVDVATLSLAERHDLLADMHLATPERVFVLARALGTLPLKLVVIGCQPVDAVNPRRGLSDPVEAALEPAVEEILRQVNLLLDSEEPLGPSGPLSGEPDRAPVRS